MKVGVTGGGGFIGGHTLEALARRGHEPVVFDHLLRGYAVDCDAMIGDVRDPTAVYELAAHVDAVIHLAAVLGTQETIRNPWPAAETNIRGGLNFLEALALYGIPGVYIAVGNHWMDNSYSISKTAVERYCRMFNNDRGARVNIVRAVNAYGPRQAAAPPFAPGKVRKITPAFVCRALCGMPIEVYGDGEQVSDMVWVGDVADVLVTALEHAETGEVHEQALEVGPAESSTVNAVAAEVIDAAVAWHDAPPAGITHLPMRPGETPGATVSADVATLAAAGIDPAGFKPLFEGIAETVAWFAANKGVTWDAPK